MFHSPITIVRPAHIHIDAAAAAQAANFTYRGGPLLTNVQIFTIFWGAPWQLPDYQKLAQNLNTFFQTIVKSPLIDQLREYNSGQYSIGRGTFLGSLNTNQPSLPPMFFGHTLVLDISIQSCLQTLIQKNVIPQPTTQTLYFVFLPAGAIIMKGSEFSCRNFCGYHNAVNNQIFYAALPYPTCYGCNNGLLPFDALTITASHELCEAITDPVPAQGWYDDTYGEIGDICAWKTKTLGPYTVQREWSQKNLACT